MLLALKKVVTRSGDADNELVVDGPDARVRNFPHPFSFLLYGAILRVSVHTLVLWF